MKSFSAIPFTALVLLLTAGNILSDEVIEEWVAFYDNPNNGWDVASSIALDVFGNVYITGSSNVGYNRNYTTIKYDNNGIEQWVTSFDGPDGCYDEPSSIAVDENANVYVTGHTGSYDYSDYATIKYDNDGVELWIARYNGPGNALDEPYAIAVDGDGSVYVTGQSYGDSTYYDFATIKYDDNGDTQWLARYNCPDNYYDAAIDIALDAFGNVYVTGLSINDYLTIKYNNDGEEQWIARFEGSMNYNRPSAIALDESGNVYVTGRSDIAGSYNYATIKYNNDGMEQWVAIYDGTGHDYDAAYSIAVDEDENVYVTGLSEGDGTDHDYATVKYDSDGVEQWVARYNGPANGDDDAYSIALDGDGNVYVFGNSDDIYGYFDYATIKYDGNGLEQWGIRYSGSADYYSDWASSIALDGDGNIYVTGSTFSSSHPDYTTIKYSQTVGLAPSQEVELGTLQLYPITPNPSEDIFTISYYTPSISEVLVEIYNLSGRLVSVFANGDQSPGLHQVQMEAMSPGVYFCRIRAGSVSLTESFVIIQ